MDARPKLLVVDDDPHLLRLFELYLRRTFFEVHLAGSGDEAIALAQETEFDVAVVDLILPTFGGLRLCGHLKESSRPPYVIIISGETGKEVRQSLSECGADEFVAKPFAPAEFVAHLEEVARARVAH
jgi:DNA-binding response OmpR family regulator